MQSLLEAINNVALVENLKKLKDDELLKAMAGADKKKAKAIEAEMKRRGLDEASKSTKKEEDEVKDKDDDDAKEKPKDKEKTPKAKKKNKKDEIEVNEGADKDTKGDDKAYQAFFQKALKKFGVTEPDQLEGDKKKEFFDYIDANWKADDEKPEPGDKAESHLLDLEMVKYLTEAREVDPADVDVDGSGEDGGKHIIMQLRKAVSLNSNKVEFKNGTKKIKGDVAARVLTKYASQKKPADKEKFQNKIWKSEKDMLATLK